MHYIWTQGQTSQSYFRKICNMHKEQWDKEDIKKSRNKDDDDEEDNADADDDNHD